jgi:hypothetical protein
MHKAVVPLTPVLVLEGSPHNRGLRHGTVLKDQIHQLVRLRKERISSQCEVPADTFIDRFMKKTHYVSAIEKYTPELVKEISGIAEGAEIDFNTMFVFQFFDEVWAQGKAISATIGGPEGVYSFECSANQGAVRFTPCSQDSVVWHTNHPLVNDDCNEGYQEWLKTAPTKNFPSNSDVRLRSLKRRLTSYGDTTRLELIKGNRSRGGGVFLRKLV